MNEHEEGVALDLGWNRENFAVWTHTEHGSLVRIYGTCWSHHPKRNMTGGDDKPITQHSSLESAVKAIEEEANR